jgi:hypothetical protein
MCIALTQFGVVSLPSCRMSLVVSRIAVASLFVVHFPQFFSPYARKSVTEGVSAQA